MHTVLLSLGANQNDPQAQLADAVRRLGRLIRVTRTSSVYRTAPVGYADQPDFLNLVCVAETELSADAVLAGALEIEREMGRERSFPNAPRVIDIDLLAYDEAVTRSPELVLPHPRMHQRAFVLAPLAEIAAEWRHPLLGRTAEELLVEIREEQRVRRMGPLV